jgi:phosphoribosylanthranilate isomerase
MAVRVKICGITNLEDARAGAEWGADALGFIFYAGSPRHISLESAAAIISKLPPFVTKVGVFVDAPVEFIRDAIRVTGIDAVQLHGSESPSFCNELARERVGVIKAFRVKDPSSLQEMGEYRTRVFLLDSYVPGQAGGTGAQFNWDVAVEAKRFGKSIILAGGLNPENVSDAVSKVVPYGVDVSSGVEASPGKKDLGKLRMFLDRARRSGV